jgi:superoxide dismutase, Fe-Mn family
MSEMNLNSRRKFLKTSIKSGLILGISGSAIATGLSSCSSTSKVVGMSKLTMEFDQKPLPYGFNALEPAIDTNTMEIHYSKHARAYATALKEASAAENVGNATLEQVLASVSKYSTKMRNNAGGHYNHEMFWRSLRKPQSNNKPTGEVLSLIERTFGSFDNFKTQFTDAAKSRFGSGWAWLYADRTKALKIGSTPNQDNPLMNLSDIQGFPLLGLDVWEHAYYLKYQNRRPEYVENWWTVVNWDYVAERWKSLV